MLTAKRTLVKSGPELWAEISDPESLGNLFAAFGEIRITKATDASLVDWVGVRAAGRLELEPSGFGTRVEIAAEIAQIEQAQAPPPPAAPEPEPEPVAVAPEPEPEPAPVPEPKRGFWARLRKRKEPEAPPAPAPAPAPAPEPVVAAPPPPPPAPRFAPAMDEDEALAVLTATLDALGMARHRPFSR
jgi:hypothetical protein